MDWSTVQRFPIYCTLQNEAGGIEPAALVSMPFQCGLIYWAEIQVPWGTITDLGGGGHSSLQHNHNHNHNTQQIQMI